jgi:hypothetical protein
VFSPNQIKSAIGNNGMFNMTNPNIYKALVPLMVGAGALKQEKDGGVTESWEDELDDDEIKALEAAGYTIERIK